MSTLLVSQFLGGLGGLFLGLLILHMQHRRASKKRRAYYLARMDEIRSNRG